VTGTGETEADFDGWLALVGLGSLTEAACLTLVRAGSPETILKAFGADLEQPALTLDEAREEMAACVGVSPWGDGFLAVEPNGGEGVRAEVLRDLSRTAAAAALFWNVNAVVVVSCASRGRMRGTEELLTLQPDSYLPKAVLRRLLVAQDNDDDLRTVALQALTTFVGLTPDPSTLGPLTFYRVIPQLADLPDAFFARQSLELFGLELLQLIDAASPDAQRASAEWIARWTLKRVGLHDDPRTISVTAQFGQGRPTTLGPGQALIVEANRTTARIRANDPSRHLGHATPEMRAAWMREHALLALRYTTVEDSLSAALGAVNCMRPFMVEPAEPAEPDAEGRYPFPDLYADLAAVEELVRPLLTEGEVTDDPAQHVPPPADARPPTH
jgi:hypothetical protein